MEGVLFAIDFSDWDAGVDVETPPSAVVKWSRAVRSDSAITKHTQINEKKAS